MWSRTRRMKSATLCSLTLKSTALWSLWFSLFSFIFSLTLSRYCSPFHFVLFFPPFLFFFPFSLLIISIYFLLFPFLSLLEIFLEKNLPFHFIVSFNCTFYFILYGLTSFGSSNIYFLLSSYLTIYSLIYYMLSHVVVKITLLPWSRSCTLMSYSLYESSALSRLSNFLSGKKCPRWLGLRKFSRISRFILSLPTRRPMGIARNDLMI